jgi:hypothetical protein
MWNSGGGAHQEVLMEDRRSDQDDSFIDDDFSARDENGADEDSWTDALASIDMAEAQALADAIAAHHGVAGVGVDLDLDDGDQSLSAGDIFARCTPKGCETSVTIDGETYALTGCGDGTCPACPTALGNLVVRAWYSYTGVSSAQAAIVLILLLGARIGPFRV